MVGAIYCISPSIIRLILRAAAPNNNNGPAVIGPVSTSRIVVSVLL